MDHGILLSTLESHSHSKEGAVRLVVALLQVKEHGIFNLQCRYRVCLITRGVAKKCAAPMGSSHAGAALRSDALVCASLARGTADWLVVHVIWCVHYYTSYIPTNVGYGGYIYAVYCPAGG